MSNFNNFFIEDLNVSRTNISNVSNEPIYNAKSLQNTNINTSLNDAPTGSVLIYNGDECTYSATGISGGLTGPVILLAIL